MSHDCPPAIAATMMASRPPQLGGRQSHLQLGGQQNQPHVTWDRTPPLQRGQSNAQISQPNTQSQCTSSASTSFCPGERRSVRRYPEHFCTFERCCYKFSDEGALLAKDFEHLPVCHNNCWTDELDRLLRNVDEAEAFIELDEDIPLCHRACYMKGLLKVRDPDWVEREVVPRNRTIEERLHVLTLEHLWEEIRESWREMERQRKGPEGVASQ